MRKTALIIIGLMLCNIPFVYSADDSHMGKRAIFRLIYEGRDQGLAIVDILGKDQNNLYRLDTQLYIENDEETLISYLSEDQLYNKKETENILAKCSSFGGEIERIYSAGRLTKSCRVDLQNPLAQEKLKLINFKLKTPSNGSLWLGHAAVYGIIKLNSPELILDITYFN